MFVILVILLALVVYYFGTRNFDYWEKRNVKHDRPVFLFGNDFQQYFGFKSKTQASVELYNKYPTEKVIGSFAGTTPELYIKDPTIVKHVLLTDFKYFHHRGLGRDPDVEPLHKNLFHAEGDMWKLLRQRLTPAFTTARLKAMFPLVVSCAEKLQGVARASAGRGGACDVRDLMARFTTEFIGACGFGVDMGSLDDENSLFRKIGRLIFTRTIATNLKIFLWDLFPFLRPFISADNPKIEETIITLLKNVRQERQFKPSSRNDFIDLLMEIESKGTLKGNSIKHFNADGSPISVNMEFDLIMMAAQVFIFFAAGFETSSSVTSYTLHELAFNPDIQSKVQAEIDEVLLKYDNKLCYDAVAEMSLLNMAMKESMRIFPSLGILNRVCTRRYTIPGLNLTIDPGVKIVIPVQALQTDEKYFENPLEFQPERFSAEQMTNHNKYVYLPFGDGPRQCIGTRLGKMQSLAGLAAVLQKFRVSPAPTTKRYPPLDPNTSVLQAFKGGLPLTLVPRD